MEDLEKEILLIVDESVKGIDEDSIHFIFNPFPFLTRPALLFLLRV